MPSRQPARRWRYASIGVLIVLSAAIFAAEHPLPITTDSNCGECHEAQAKGKFVHSAIAAGCTSCHYAKVTGETTTVNLIQPKQELCFRCHDKQVGESVHAPYAAGECTQCHDPHASDYPRQLKAKLNDICLRCHLDGTMPAEMQSSAARVYLDKDHVFGHPYSGHPVGGHPDPLNPSTEMTCLSCHVPHEGNELKLLASVHTQSADLLNNEAPPTHDICLQCHVQINKDTQESGRRHSYEVTGPASALEPKEKPSRRHSPAK